MALFSKKTCSICGGEIGLFGNRKLEDGNMCKHCAAKLSPWFSDRRRSTVVDILGQLDYREANKEKVAAFRPTKTLGNDNVKLSWNLPIEGEPNAYRLYRDDALIATVTELQYSDYDLPSGTHRYTISAVYLEGESVQVGPVVVETTEGLNESEGTSLRVYPTCFSSVLTVESDIPSMINLYNMTGQCLMTKQIQAGSNRIDASSLVDGVYFIKAAEGQTMKIVKF